MWIESATAEECVQVSERRRLSRTVLAALTRRNAAIALALLLAVAAPLLVRSFVTFQLSMVLVYGIAVVGMTLLMGINGQFSLGHSAFFAVGAYTSAGLVHHLGVPYLLTIPAAAVAAFAVGLLFRIPTLRLDGVYLALATFALGIAMPQLFKSSLLARWTGGAQGIVLDKPEAPLGLPLDPDQWLYYVVLAVAVALAWCAANLVDSRTGRALIAIRDHPTAASSMGIDLALYKSALFGVSALYAGVAGALCAIVVQYVASDSFTVLLSIALFIGVVVGGARSVAGAFVGGAFVLFVPNVAERVSKDGAGVVYGVIVIAVVVLMPSGVAGVVRLVGDRLVRSRR